ncbi:MAG: ABC transporter permease [Acidobacteriia bacterium]|nr:ABC transporter permease [Terriglobia bacterium]
MLEFWRNPEFVRHLRAELRPPRAITAAFLAVVVCALAGLACWASEHENLRVFFRTFHGWLVGIQFVGLAFWCASGCGQAITRERELKTYDFLKTTRLTAGEIVLGKILGAPIMGYFVVGCTLPISLAVGALGGYGLGTLVGVYVLLLAFALFVSLMGLWLSMLLEKSSSAAVAILTLLPIGRLRRLARTDARPESEKGPGADRPALAVAGGRFRRVPECAPLRLPESASSDLDGGLSHDPAGGGCHPGHGHERPVHFRGGTGHAHSP